LDDDFAKRTLRTLRRRRRRAKAGNTTTTTTTTKSAFVRGAVGILFL
jgi:hypothetical protein